MHDFQLLPTLLIFLLSAGISTGIGEARTPMPENPKIDSQTPSSALVAFLGSEDGETTAKATAEAFRRGSSLLPELEKAGAKPMLTIHPTRLDVVYSVLKGRLPGNYRKESFGLHLRPNVTSDDVARMGKKHGFTLSSKKRFDSDSSPNCYVNLSPGKSLDQVIRSVLEQEPGVLTVNLNYTES